VPKVNFQWAADRIAKPPITNHRLEGNDLRCDPPRKDIQGQCIRVVAHIRDREPKTLNSGPTATEMARTHLAMAAIRPTLAAQAATRYTPDTGAATEECK
jgi:hypothetical protein